MADLTQPKIDALILIDKSLLDEIEWHQRDNNRMREFFRVNVLSESDDKFAFEAYYNRETRKILLTLRYKNIALVTLHKNVHTNPDGTVIRGWHKQKFREVEHRKLAINVDHEFNDAMMRKDVIFQFMRENSIHFGGHRYQENVDGPY